MRKTLTHHLYYQWKPGEKDRGGMPIRVVCYSCGKQFMLHKGWANVAGAPFKSWYCNGCKEEVDA